MTGRRHPFTPASTRPGGRTVTVNDERMVLEAFDLGLEIGTRHGGASASLVDLAEAYALGYGGNLIGDAATVEAFTGDLLRAYLAGVRDRTDLDSGEVGR